MHSYFLFQKEVFVLFNIYDTITENTIDDNSLTSLYHEENLFIYATKELSLIREDYMNANMILRKSILESNSDMVVINESFSDFLAKVKEIIKKFIDFIKSLFQRFITQLNKIVLSEKYLTKHKDDFNKFSSDDEFTYKGYKFTFNPLIPVVDPVRHYDQDLLGIDFTQLTDDNIGETIKKLYSTTNKDMLDETIYDAVRGEVLGKNEAIFKEEFADELFEIYRDGMSDKSEMDITSSEVNENLVFFKNYNKLLETTKKQKNNIEHEYKKLEKHVQNMVNKEDKVLKGMSTITLNTTAGGDPTSSIKISNDTSIVLNNYINAKCTQIVEISNIHSLAFAAKLEAEKEAFKQSKDILYKALSKIQKRGDK